MQRYFKRIGGVGSGNYICFWKSNGLSNKKINSITTSNYSITPELLSYYGTKTRAEFNGSCLKQDQIMYNHGAIINIYIVYEISKSFDISSYPTLKSYFLGASKLTKHIDIDESKYSGYGFGFDRTFKFSNGFGRNCIIFGVDMSSSGNVDNKKKNILFLGKDPTQGLDGTTLTAEKNYSISFTGTSKKICLSLHYNGANNYLFVNSTEVIDFKAKDSEIAVTPLCLGNVS